MKIPILKLKDILLTSIQVDLIDEEALDFQNDVLKAVTEQEARGIIIDITALTVVDSFLARIINELATMVQLVGCEVTLEWRKFKRSCRRGTMWSSFLKRRIEHDTINDKD